MCWRRSKSELSFPIMVDLHISEIHFARVSNSWDHLECVWRDRETLWSHISGQLLKEGKDGSRGRGKQQAVSIALLALKLSFAIGMWTWNYIQTHWTKTYPHSLAIFPRSSGVPPYMAVSGLSFWPGVAQLCHVPF